MTNPQLLLEGVDIDCPIDASAVEEGAGH